MPGERQITVHGRPPTYNVVKKHSPHKQRDIRDAWRRACGDAIDRLGLADGDCWDSVDVVAQPFYLDRRNLPDTDGPAPAVKWLLDELVARGHLAGDTRDQVRSVKLLFAWVDRDLGSPRLVVCIRPAK